MSEQEVFEWLDAVYWWQHESGAHPLACGNDSSHEKLFGFGTVNNEVELHCPDCDYVQKWVPDVVMNAYKELGG